VKLLEITKQTLRNKLRGKSFLKNVLLLAGGTAVAQLIMIASSPIVSRIYSPEEIGVLSVYTSILSMLAAFATLRFELAIPIAEDDIGAVNVLALCVTSVLVVSAIVLAIALVFSNPIVKLFNAEQLEPFLWLLSIGVFGIGLYTTTMHWAIRKKAFKDITRTKINQGIAKSSTQIGLGLVGLGPLGLVIGEILGQAFGIRALSKSLLKRDRKLLGKINLHSMKLMSIRYRKFPLISSWSTLLNTAGLQIPVLILSALYGAEVTGSFGFAKKIISLPLALIGVAISQVFFSEGATLSKEDPEKLLKLTTNTSKRLLFLGLLVAAIIIPFGPSIFAFVFGDAWREAGVYSQVLSIMLMIRFAVNPISQVLSIIEKQGTQFLLDLLRVLVIVAAFYISKLLGFPPLAAVVAYTVAMIIIYAITYLIIIRSLKLKVRDFNRQYPVN
jgi:O-antigen/teichoic acid export membrane protein